MPKRKKSHKPSPSTTDKRPRLDAPTGYIDPTTGQRGAFPGLEDTSDEFYGPANDGLEYLKMVRSERKHVPTLLIAKAPPVLEYDDGEYHDGTYTARAVPTADTAAPLFHAPVMERFVAFRERFHRGGVKGVRVVSGTVPVWRQRQQWQKHVLGTRPTPGMVAGMEQMMAVRVLGWCAGMVKGGVKGWWGEWVWGCFVRLDKCLTGEEVCVLREVGKRCLQVREGMVKGRRWVDVEGEVEDEEVKAEEEVEEEVSGVQELEEGEEPSSPINLAEMGLNPEEIDLNLEPEEYSPPINIEPIPPSPPAVVSDVKEHSYVDTLATLDMVISIVGDFFGQRDLLVERDMQGWGERG